MINIQNGSKDLDLLEKYELINITKEINSAHGRKEEIEFRATV